MKWKNWDEKCVETEYCNTRELILSREALIEKRIKKSNRSGDDGHEGLRFAISIGASAFSENYASIDEMINEADTRMYAHKKRKS